jgi:DNA-binding transcriptional LysR family regulator
MFKSGLVELEAVAAIARRGSFRAAAIELGMSPTSLGSAVAGLEKRLGVRLFNRTTRSVSLTEAGEQFLARVAPALAEIQGAFEGVNSHRERPAGTLRLNSSVGAAARLLDPFVLEFLRRYPDMRVEITTEDRLVDVVAEGFDAGIRLMDSVPADMIAVPFGSDLDYVIVGAPSYFAERPRPEKPGDLMNHECIRARWPSGGLYRWEFARGGEAFTLDVPGRLTLDEHSLMINAALAGAGLVYLWELPVRAHIAAGRLVPVLKEWTISSSGLCLYYSGRRHVPAGLRAFIDLIRELERSG